MKLNTASPKAQRFISVWSLADEVNMGEQAFKEVPPDVIGVIVEYENVSHCIPSNATWWQLRLAAEELIRRSGDTDHVFIEGFNVKSKDRIQMYTGS